MNQVSESSRGPKQLKQQTRPSMSAKTDGVRTTAQFHTTVGSLRIGKVFSVRKHLHILRALFPFHYSSLWLEWKKRRLQMKRCWTWWRWKSEAPESVGSSIIFIKSSSSSLFQEPNAVWCFWSDKSSTLKRCWAAQLCFYFLILDESNWISVGKLAIIS